VSSTDDPRAVMVYRWSEISDDTRLVKYDWRDPKRIDWKGASIMSNGKQAGYGTIKSACIVHAVMEGIL